MYKKPGRRPYTSPGLFRRLSGLHGVPEPVGDSTFKQAGGVAVEGVFPVMDRSMSKMNFTSGSWGTPGAFRFTTPGPAWTLA